MTHEYKLDEILTYEYDQKRVRRKAQGAKMMKRAKCQHAIRIRFGTKKKC